MYENKPMRDVQQTGSLKGGLHDDVTRLASRIGQANRGLGGILDKLRGPMPEPSTDSAKSPEVPPIIDLVRECHNGLADLEEQLKSLSGLISG